MDTGSTRKDQSQGEMMKKLRESLTPVRGGGNFVLDLSQASRRLADNPDLIWGSWLALIGSTFAALESRALKKEPGHTLTAFTKRWLGIRPRRPWSLGGSSAFVAALVWVAIHILVEVATEMESAIAGAQQPRSDTDSPHAG